LQRNSLSGSIPRSVGLLDNLLYLNIKDNEALSGRLPLNELMSLTKLNRLSLVHCNFQDAEADVETLKAALPRCKIWI
jgi:Leucine-rich repeat (LRR) protein